MQGQECGQVREVNRVQVQSPADANSLCRTDRNLRVPDVKSWA